MILQIGMIKKWKNVVAFDKSRQYEVEDAAASLSRAAGGLDLRIIDGDKSVRYLNENGVFRPLHEARK